MKRFGQIILIIMFLSIIFIIPMLTKLQKNQAISQFENRKLAEAPVFTETSLLNGEYFGKWETYLSDHIYGRNAWIKNYITMNMLVLGKEKLNDIVIGKKGFLLPFLNYDDKYYSINKEENLSKMAEQLKELQDKLAQKGGSFYFVGVPSQASYHKEEYPKQLQISNNLMYKTEQLLFDKLDQLDVSYINMNNVFRNKPEIEYYYKTDHHYNFEGAYATYYEIIKTVKQKVDQRVQPPLEKADLDIVTLPNPFGGSRNRQIYYMFPTQEKIKIAYPKNKIPYEKFNNGKPDNKLYYLSENKAAMINYGVYMGGDWAETVIKTNNDMLPNLLVFGDSFTNAIEPLLYNHFNETRILDLRYYDKMSLYEYIDKYKPDIVLMLRDDLNYGNLEGNGSFKGKNIKN
ncbi:MAG: hypothetical protein A2Y23_10530 [Clostridiales bacterium GWB2_37_7]|nr:MAG: hypothetical protein A2Y23_10530 [Clostridiales bacterium GWB2_37_7]